MAWLAWHYPDLRPCISIACEIVIDLVAARWYAPRCLMSMRAKRDNSAYLIDTLTSKGRHENIYAIDRLKWLKMK